MLVLGIESSCDETAVAVVDSDAPAGQRVVSHALHSQIETHATTGGVVPEVAARAHLQNIHPLTCQALDAANLSAADIDLVASVAGPGLIGGVSVGFMFAKGLALAHSKPLIPVNHLAGHALTGRMTHDVAYPFLLLLVSGGHCQLLVVKSPTHFERLATTIDDAVGEAFDKAAKIMGLGFPGGPAIERAAKAGDPSRFDLPRPMVKKATMDFSFSGLKTATARALESCQSDQDVLDLAASFQAAAVDSLIAQTQKAVVHFQAHFPKGTSLVVAGGVARNLKVREKLAALGAAHALEVVTPELEWCTDNAAMIAWAGFEQFAAQPSLATNSLTQAPRPRWPLDPLAEPSIFAGRKKA